MRMVSKWDGVRGWAMRCVCCVCVVCVCVWCVCVVCVCGCVCGGGWVAESGTFVPIPFLHRTFGRAVSSCEQMRSPSQSSARS